MTVRLTTCFGAQKKRKARPPTDGDGLSETQRQIMECVGQMSAREQEAFLPGCKHRKGAVECIHKELNKSRGFV